MIDINNAADLRTVYLQTYDGFAITPSDVRDQNKHINLRYARELLGVLVHGGLVTVGEGDEGDVWQTFPDTYDTMSREEAEARIDGWLGVQAPPSQEPGSSTSTSRTKLTSAVMGPHPCNCGCGETITTRAMYRPGHDARHAGAVGRQIAQDGDESALDALPSENLRSKALRVAHNAMTKGAKAKPEPVRDEDTVDAGDDGTANVVHGVVKVGKTEYIAVKYTLSGDVDYFKGDETLKASKTAAKTFQEG